MNKRSYSLTLFIFIVFLPFWVNAATYYSRANGNWTTASTWSTISCSGAISASVPTAADNVIICTGRTVTMNGLSAACLSLTINGTANWSLLGTTTVGAGGLTLNNGAILSGIGTGTLVVNGPMTVPVGATVTVAAVNLTVNGLATISGTFTDNNIGGANTFANVNLNSTGSFLNSASETYTITGNLNTYGGDFLVSGMQTPVFNIGGDMNVVSGSCDISAIIIEVTGNTVISGTMNITAVRGTKTFNDLTVNAGGTFNSSVGEDYQIKGNITVNGTFNANSGIFTLSGLGKTISGSSSLIIDDVTCSGYYTNHGNIRFLSSFRGTGTWVQGTGTVTLETSVGSFSVATFNASAVGNTVVYNRSSNQSVVEPSDGAYYNLTVQNGGTKSLADPTIVTGSVTIGTGTTLTTSNNALSVGRNFTNNGSFTAGSGTVTLNGTVGQTIGGTAATAFNSLNITNSGGVITGATNFSVSTTLTIGAGAILSPNAAVIVSGGGTLTGSGTARVTRIAATADFISQYTITGKILAGLTIDYTGAGNQSVNPLNYGSLTISTNGTRTVTFPAAVVGVSNVFLPSQVTTNYMVTGNTVTMNGTIPQSVPAFTYNNLITAGSAAKTLSGNIVVNNDLTITSNLDVSASNYSIAVKRNWIKNGTFNAQNGTVTFNGSTAQTLSGTGTTTFHQLDINNSSGGVSLISGSYLLNAVISPLNGNFNTGGMPFTMVSSASRTARIAPKGAAASLTGNFTIQRFISTRDTSFCDLSSTVQASTIGDWDNELPALSYTHTPPVALASAFTYDESSDVYVPVTAAGTAITPGRGFEVFLAGDYFYASLPNTTMDAVGVPNQGDQNLSGLISNNGQGWNLVGNPFASSISWASVYAASGGAASGLYDFVEMYDYTIGDWNGYTSGDGIEIGSSQGFWVYGLPGATSLTLLVPESSKTTASNSSIKCESQNSFFSLKISSPLNSFSHTFRVNTRADASNELDAFDLPFRASPNKATPALYTNVEGKNVNLNTFNSTSDHYAVPLIIKVSSRGKYKMEAAGLDMIQGYSCVQLEDRAKGTFINLNIQGAYEFESYLLEDTKRFVLHFYKDGDCRTSQTFARADVDLAEVIPAAGGSIVNFSYPEYTEVSVSVINILGQDILPVRTLTVKNESHTIQLPSGFTGVYFVQVSSDKGNVVKKIYKN